MICPMEKNLDNSIKNYHLIHTEQAFRKFFESAPMMMGIADVEGDGIRHVADNQAAADFSICH